MGALRLVALLTVTTGCAYISKDDADVRLDPDGDGVQIGDDCDDQDGEVGAPSAWYVDSDGDGFGAAEETVTACERPDGFVATDTDCDDDDATAYPGASDEWYDDVDSDCAGNDDFDQDGDGFAVGDECDDTDPELYPSDDPEIYFNGVDDNCDPADQDGDQDGDGFWAWNYVSLVNATGAVPADIPDGAAGDCWDDPTTVRSGFDTVNGFDDVRANEVFPGAEERYYDGVDQDCGGIDSNGDGLVDDFDWDLDGEASKVWPDRSGVAGTDCIDCGCLGSDCPSTCSAEPENPGGVDPAEVNTEASETWYDGTNQNCVGDDDFDIDRDGYACDASFGGACAGTDCDDLDARVNPGAAETYYDGVDQNCDGLSDFDRDRDGYDADAWGGSDCDDTTGLVNPGATEVWYDGRDQDCDGASDYDQDGDGYDSDDYSGTDCDDTNASVNPGATEIEGNDIDDDCDGTSNFNAIEGSSPVSRLDAIFRGEASSDGAGRRVKGAGDVDGDGKDDLLIGAPYASAFGTYSGTAYLVTGTTTGTLSLSSATAALHGEDVGDWAGFGLTSLGDQNNDGYDDFAVGAPYDDPSGVTNAGSTFVFLGPVSDDTYASSAADAQYTGAYSGSSAGMRLNAGDLDQDGVVDLVVGAHFDDWDGSNSGRVSIVEGPATSDSSLSDAVEISPEQGDYDYLGHALATGDADGDGYDDLAIGAPRASLDNLTSNGGVYVIYGPVTDSTEVSVLADRRYVGSDAYDYFGYDVSLGDVDDDGYADLAAGAPYADNASGTATGVLYVVSATASSGSASSAAYATLSGGSAGADMGVSVDATGDFDSDGVQDLVIGAEDESLGSETQPGAVWFLFGPVTSGTTSASSTRHPVRYGTESHESVGSSVANVGDADGDGYDDVLIGAPGNDFAATNSGAAYLLLGGAL